MAQMGRSFNSRFISIGRPGKSARLAAVLLTALGTGTLLASAQTATPPATEAACPAGTPTSGASGDACVEIGEYDIYFKPNLATIPSETEVTVVLPNHGAALHNFSITDHENSGLENLDISVDIDPGATEQTTINAPEGEYYFFCNQPGHEQAGMRGYLTVKKDATIETSEATVTPRAG
jgi:uncharacterized cupredoxin-like copper-binding protein